MAIRVASITHPGKGSKLNQDAVYAKTWVLPAREVGAIAVADGMGGYANGEIAAGTAIECIDTFFKGVFGAVCPDISALSLALDTAFLTCHEKIKRINSEAGDKSGTTLAVCVSYRTDFIVKNVGDTRCYILSGDGLRQISTDDSWIAEQVRFGALTESEARKHKKQNLLTRCLGIGTDAIPHSFAGVSLRGQVLAVCSDGFYKTLEPDEITTAISVWRDNNNNPLNLVLPSLFERGESDNISLCLMC